MGLFISIITEKPVITKFAFESENNGIIRYDFMSRGFGTLLEFSRNNSSEILDTLEKALDTEVWFLTEPQYYDKDLIFAELDYEDEDEETFEEADSSGYNQLTPIEPFLSKAIAMQVAMKAKPVFEKEINYDKSFWGNYFESEFQTEIDNLILFLSEAKNQDCFSFSIEIAY